jgi:hypothetical protein
VAQDREVVKEGTVTLPRLLVHGVIGLLIFILITYLFSPLGGLIFFLSGLLVDLDHLVGYYFLRKDWTWNLKVEYEKVTEWWTETHARDIRYVHWLFLHRIEPWVSVAYFSPYPFNLIGAGALSNLLLDLLAWPQRIKYMTIAMDLAKLV